MNSRVVESYVAVVSNARTLVPDKVYTVTKLHFKVHGSLLDVELLMVVLMSLVLSDVKHVIA
jgi:hypothetical protein